MNPLKSYDEIICDLPFPNAFIQMPFSYVFPPNIVTIWLPIQNTSEIPQKKPYNEITDLVNMMKFTGFINSLFFVTENINHITET